MSAPAAVAVHRPVASYRTNLVTALLSIWFVAGLMLDAWAHNNLAGLETFFTPWHAVFYSGFAATAGWILWTVRRSLPDGLAGLATMPAGYAGATVAVAGFALAGGADATWHQVFGIEQHINILFSPTHLALGTAMAVIVSTPLRAAWADRSGAHQPGLPALLATGLTTTLIMLFVQYGNALTYHSGGVLVAFSGMDEQFTSELVTAMLVTNLVLLVPLLVLARRWPLPFGTATLLYLTVSALSTAVTGLENLELVAGVVGAGVLVDVLARWLRPGAEARTRYRLFAALAPLLTWTVYLGTAYLTAPSLAPIGGTAHPEGVVELYTGAPVVQALIGLLLAIVLVPGTADGRDAAEGRDRAAKEIEV
jgi:hypothetical protein